MPRQLKVDYPDELPDALQESPEQFEKEARMAMAVKLFEMKRVSSGVAARLAGTGRVAFLLELHKYGVPMVDMDESEFEEDLRNA
jgi:predicted HTH domain antitoxin